MDTTFFRGTNGTNGNGRVPYGGILGPDGEVWRRDQDSNRLDEYDPGMSLPHVLTFGALLRGSSNTYFRERFDEAMRHSRENAMAMRRDEHLQACLRERIRGTTSLAWRLEPDNKKDPMQKLVAKGVERAIRAGYRIKRLQKQSMQATWFGRYGSQIQWEWRMMDLPGQRGVDEPTKTLTVKRHIPVNGDKIDYTWSHVPTVRLYSGKASNYPAEDTVLDNLGYSLVLGPKYRSKFIIHTWEPDDGDFYDAESGSSVHGKGIRDWLYWSWWTKNEYMTNVIDALERFGLGIIVVKYPAGNPTAQTEAEKIARNYSRRSILTVPVDPATMRGGDGIEVIQTPTAGMEVLLLLQKACEDREQRFIIAQTLSSDHRGSGGLGGSGAAEFEQETKWDVIEDDSSELAETLTGTDDEPGLVSMIKKHTYPWADFPIRWVYDIEPRESEKRMGVITEAFNMGAKVPESKVLELAGVAEAAPDETILQNPAFAQLEMQQQMAEQQAAGMPGQPGEPGAEGGAGGPGAEPGGEGGDSPASGPQEPGSGTGDAAFDRLFEGQEGGKEPQPGESGVEAGAKNLPGPDGNDAKPENDNFDEGRPFFRTGREDGKDKPFFRGGKDVENKDDRPFFRSGNEPDEGQSPFSDEELEELFKTIVDTPNQGEKRKYEGEEDVLRYNEGTGTPPSLGHVSGASGGSAGTGEHHATPSTAPRVALPASTVARINSGYRVDAPTAVSHQISQGRPFIVGSLRQLVPAEVETSELRQHLGNAVAAGQLATTEHPETGQNWYHPPGFDINSHFRSLSPANAAHPMPVALGHVKQLMSRHLGDVQSFSDGRMLLASAHGRTTSFLFEPPARFAGQSIPAAVEMAFRHDNNTQKRGIWQPNATLQKDSIQFMKKLGNVVSGMATQGVNLKYTADQQHRAAYRKWLPRLGYELAQTVGDEHDPNEMVLDVWKPKVAAAGTPAKSADKPFFAGGEKTHYEYDANQPRDLQGRWVDTDLRTRIRLAAEEVDRGPTPAQKEAGNYKCGHVSIQGLDVTIENPAGSVRSGKSKAGVEWRVRMRHHYGYLKKTAGETADGDHLDVFIGPYPESGLVFVVDQTKPSGAFDEHKVLLAFTNKEQAKQGYLANYSKGWRNFRGLKSFTMEGFKKWLEHGDLRRPAVGQKVMMAEVPETIHYDAKGMEGGHWVTIGAKDSDGKRHGGTPVYIQGGRITKGAKSLVGRSIDALHEDPKYPHRGHFSKEARQHGISPKHVHQLAADMLAHDAEHVKGYNSMLKDARAELKAHDLLSGRKGGQVKNLRQLAGRGVDATKIKRLDIVARTIQKRHPEYFNRDDGPDELFEKLVEGNRQPLTEEDAYQHAFEHLHEQHKRDAVPFADDAPKVQYATDKPAKSKPFFRSTRLDYAEPLGRQGAANPAHAGSFAKSGEGVRQPNLEKPDVHHVAAAPAVQPPQLAANKPISLSPVKAAEDLSKTLMQPQQAAQQNAQQRPQIQPGGLGEHLASGKADTAHLLHSGDFPWHIAKPGDHAAMVEHLGKMPPVDFWSLAKQVSHGLHAGKGQHAEDALDVLHGAAMVAPNGPRINAQSPEAKNAFLVNPKSLGPVQEMKVDALLRGLPQIEDERLADAGVHAVIPPAGMDVQKFLGSKLPVDVRPFSPSEAGKIGEENAAQVQGLVGAEKNKLPSDWDTGKRLDDAQKWKGRASLAKLADFKSPEADKVKPATAPPTREAMADSQIVQSKPVGSQDHVNAVFRVKMSNGHEAAFKPQAGELDIRIRDGIEPGTLWNRETANSGFADAIGFDKLVPPTNAHEFEGQKGSAQAWLHDAIVASRKTQSERFNGPEGLARAALFDYLAGQSDRNRNNWMVGADGSIWINDNGYSWPSAYDETLGTSLLAREAADRNLNAPSILHHEHNWPELEKSLVESGLEPEAIKLGKERFDAAIANQKKGDFSIRNLPAFVKGYNSFGHMVGASET